MLRRISTVLLWKNTILCDIMATSNGFYFFFMEKLAAKEEKKMAFNNGVGTNYSNFSDLYQGIGSSSSVAQKISQLKEEIRQVKVQ